jgi:hypothetical protein
MGIIGRVCSIWATAGISGQTHAELPCLLLHVRLYSTPSTFARNWKFGKLRGAACEVTNATLQVMGSTWGKAGTQDVPCSGTVHGEVSRPGVACSVDVGRGADKPSAWKISFTKCYAGLQTMAVLSCFALRRIWKKKNVLRISGSRREQVVPGTIQSPLCCCADV